MTLPKRLAHPSRRSELRGYAIFAASRVLMYGAFAAWCVGRSQGAW